MSLSAYGLNETSKLSDSVDRTSYHRGYGLASDTGFVADRTGWEGVRAVSEDLIAHEAELAKAEEQRIQSVETQAGAVLTVVLAIVAFAASAINKKTFEDNLALIALVMAFLLIAACFAVAALGPRALKVKPWTALQRSYRAKETALEATEDALKAASPDSATAVAILANWRARRDISIFLAERKALWLTCALACLLLAFVSAGVTALQIAG